jgi:hypothetical protein
MVQLEQVLLLSGIVHNSHGNKFMLCSLRHAYAVSSLRRGIGVFDVLQERQCRPRATPGNWTDAAMRCHLAVNR